MPTRARNGARIVLRSMIALVRAICACATSRAAACLSTSSCGYGALLAQASHAGRACVCASPPGPPAPSARPARRRRRARRAACLPRRSARVEPDMAHRARQLIAKLIERMATTVPIDVVIGRYGRCFATAAVTASVGSGWCAEIGIRPPEVGVLPCGKAPADRDDDRDQQRRPRPPTMTHTGTRIHEQPPRP